MLEVRPGLLFSALPSTSLATSAITLLKQESSRLDAAIQALEGTSGGSEAYLGDDAEALGSATCRVILPFDTSRPRRLIELSNVTHMASRTLAENPPCIASKPP